MKSTNKITQQVLSVSILSLLGHYAAAQSLDEAVAIQLGLDPVAGQNCLPLLGANGDIDTLVGGLRRICGRPAPQGAEQNSNSGGGGAGTATSVPAAVRERMERDEEEETTRQFSFFASAGYIPFDRSVSLFEDGYESKIVSLTAGFDMRMKSGLVLGLAATGAKQNGDFASGGELEVGSVGLTGFGAHRFGESGYVQTYAGVTKAAHDRTRLATFREFDTQSNLLLVEAGGLQAADFDATQINAGILFGYPLTFDNITVGPVLSYDYSNTSTDGYSEAFTPSEFTLTGGGTDEELASALALNFYDTREVSKVTSMGIEGTAAISTHWGVVMVQQNVFWRFEAGRDQRTDDVSFVQDTLARRFSFQTEPDDDQYIEYNIGFNFMRASGVSFYLNYSAIASHKFYDTSMFTAGFHRGL